MYDEIFGHEDNADIDGLTNYGDAAYYAELEAQHLAEQERIEQQEVEDADNGHHQPSNANLNIQSLDLGIEMVVNKRVVKAKAAIIDEWWNVTDRDGNPALYLPVSERSEKEISAIQEVLSTQNIDHTLKHSSLDGGQQVLSVANSQNTDLLEDLRRDISCEFDKGRILIENAEWVKIIDENDGKEYFLLNEMLDDLDKEAVELALEVNGFGYAESSLYSNALVVKNPDRESFDRLRTKWTQNAESMDGKGNSQAPADHVDLYYHRPQQNKC